MRFLVLLAVLFGSFLVSADSASAREVRKGPLSPYSRSYRAPLRSMARVYLKGKRELRRDRRASRVGLFGNATFRPQGRF